MTGRDKPNMVLVEAHHDERVMRGREVELLLEQGEESIRKKGTRPLRQFIGEFKRAKKISG